MFRIGTLLRVVALTALLSVFGFCTASAAGFTVFVKPLEVFNAPDVQSLAPGLRSMVASRVSGPAYSVTTDELIDPRFSVRITITRLGGVYSVDGVLETSGPATEGTRAYETVSTPDDLVGALDKVTAVIGGKLGRLAAGTVATQPPEYVPPPPIQPAVATPPPAHSAPPVQTAGPVDLGAALSVYKTLGKIEGEANAFEVADVDGDGTSELLLMNDEGVLSAYRDNGEEVALLWEKEVKPDFKPKWFSAGDVDGDGVAEIFIVGYNGFDVYTRAYTFTGGELAPRGERLYRMLRVVEHPDQGTILVGFRSAGGSEVIRKPLQKYSWNGSAYEGGEELKMPKVIMPVNIDWIRFDQGDPYLLAMDKFNRLRIYDSALKEQYVSEELFKGSPIQFEGEMRDIWGEVEGDTWELAPSAVTWDAPDGKRYAIVHDNVEEHGLMPTNWSKYDHGQLAALRWDGMALMMGAQSPKFPGYFAGLDAGQPDANGRRRLYALLVKVDGILVKDYTTFIVAFDI